MTKQSTAPTGNTKAETLTDKDLDKVKGGAKFDGVDGSKTGTSPNNKRADKG